MFLSLDDGVTWTLISDPFTSDTSGTPHLPRLRYAYFDAEGGANAGIYVGAQGRGVWRVDLGFLFSDGFESGDTAAWSNTVP